MCTLPVMTHAARSNSAERGGGPMANSPSRTFRAEDYAMPQPADKPPYEPLHNGAYSSDGSTILGVVPEKHECRPWNGKTYNAPVGTLLRCPCGQHWYKYNDDLTRATDRWMKVGGLRLWRLRRAIQNASVDSDSAPSAPEGER